MLIRLVIIEKINIDIQLHKMKSINKTYKIKMKKYKWNVVKIYKVLFTNNKINSFLIKTALRMQKAIVLHLKVV
jgi:hypothetical protein